MRAARSAAPAGTWGDRLLALALAGLALIEIWVQPVFQTGLPGPRGAVTAVALLATLPIALRRSRPLPVLAVITVATVGLGLVGDRDQAAFEALLAMLLASYSVAAHGTREAAAGGAAIVLAGSVAYSALTYGDADVPVDVLVPFVFLTAAWLVGAEVGRHRRRSRALTETAARLAEERDRRADAAAERERARIARELHDAVAHSVGLAVMHVGAARLLQGDDPDHSRELLLSAEARGREALAEMRRMLGILRAEDGEPLAPVASLRQLDALVERVRGAGLDIDLRVEGRPERLPPGLDLSAYRIVQEALTNALRHGRGSAAVRVSYRGDALRLEVRNPCGTADGTGADAGLGLVGVQERVRLFSGSVSFGAERGEWTLRARLPLDGAAP